MGCSDILVTARIPNGAPSGDMRENAPVPARTGGISRAYTLSSSHHSYLTASTFLCLLSFSSVIVVGKMTSSKSNDECAMFAKRIAKLSDLPADCRDMKKQPIVATSSSKLYVPTWKYMDDYSGV